MKLKLPQLSLMIGNCSLLLILILAATSELNAADLLPVSENWLLAKLQTGETDSLREVLPALPEHTAAGQFFKGLFEPDGESARFFYDRTVALYPGSIFEPYALQRLWQYHLTKGDLEMAEKYWNFLERRHPVHRCLQNEPDFRRVDDLAALVQRANLKLDVLPGQLDHQSFFWTVQLGAFMQAEGAHRTAGQARSWGEVRIEKKTYQGRELTVVQVGRFSNRDEADRLSQKIRESSDLRGRVVKVEH